MVAQAFALRRRPLARVEPDTSGSSGLGSPIDRRALLQGLAASAGWPLTAMAQPVAGELSFIATGDWGRIFGLSRETLDLEFRDLKGASLYRMHRVHSIRPKASSWPQPKTRLETAP